MFKERSRASGSRVGDGAAGLLPGSALPHLAVLGEELEQDALGGVIRHVEAAAQPLVRHHLLGGRGAAKAAARGVNDAAAAAGGAGAAPAHQSGPAARSKHARPIKTDSSASEAPENCQSALGPLRACSWSLTMSSSSDKMPETVATVMAATDASQLSAAEGAGCAASAPACRRLQAAMMRDHKAGRRSEAAAGAPHSNARGATAVLAPAGGRRTAWSCCCLSSQVHASEAFYIKW